MSVGVTVWICEEGDDDEQIPETSPSSSAHS